MGGDVGNAHGTVDSSGAANAGGDVGGACRAAGGSVGKACGVADGVGVASTGVAAWSTGSGVGKAQGAAGRSHMASAGVRFVTVAVEAGMDIDGAGHHAAAVVVTGDVAVVDALFLVLGLLPPGSYAKL